MRRELPRRRGIMFDLNLHVQAGSHVANVSRMFPCGRPAQQPDGEGKSLRLAYGVPRPPSHGLFVFHGALFILE